MDYYGVLGISRQSAVDEIKRAYKKLAVKYHPDKNLGNSQAEEKFKVVTEAYQVLSDPTKREIYNRFGQNGLNKESNPFPQQKVSPEDIFANLFGENFFNCCSECSGDEQNLRGFCNDAFFPDGFSTTNTTQGCCSGANTRTQFQPHQSHTPSAGRYGSQGPRRGKDATFALQVDLADLYTGKTKHLKIKRNICCTQCKGRGVLRDNGQGPCAGCSGSGFKIGMYQTSAGAVQQVPTLCNECRGQGSGLREEDRCLQCKGAKVMVEEKTLEVVIEAGAEEGQVILFEGLSDQMTPDTIPGDVMVILKQKGDPLDRWYKRGQDLVYQHSLTLSEALTGFEFYLTHLDGRVLQIASEPGAIIKPEGDIKVIENEGMPYRNKPGMKGHLYIELSVEFPTTLTSEQQRGLERVLPKKPLPKLAEGTIAKTLTAVSVDSIRAAGIPSNNASNLPPSKKKRTVNGLGGEKRKWFQRVSNFFDTSNRASSKES